MDWNVTSVGKPIPASYTTQVTEGTVLVDIMNKAADENTNGPYNKWASTYFGGLGHFITSMNGTEQVCAQHLNSPQWNQFNEKERPGIFLSVIIVQQRLVKTISYSSHLLQQLPHG